MLDHDSYYEEVIGSSKRYWKKRGEQREAEANECYLRACALLGIEPAEQFKPKLDADSNPK